MAKVSNSFHSSSGKHSISDSGKLAKVQSHNDRGYFSWEYDQGKIHHLIGDNNSLVDDVANYINEKFQKEIDAYNERQKQACRRIKTDAYTHFCENKKLDIANEVIFQVADKEYWNRFRQEKLITKNNKKYVLKSYPEEVKSVMDEIFKRQAYAYEHIYETHKQLVLNKVLEAYRSAEQTLNTIEPDKKERFESIAKKSPKERTPILKCMNENEREEYASFFEAYETKTSIDKKNLIERIEKDAMEIKLVGMTGHYDEWSPHAHGISVCSTSGYKTGLNSRVAKSVVLNKYALEVIQDRMREIAKEEMDKHPEIFSEAELANKSKGRNYDYDTEQWIRIRQAELVEQTKQAEERAAQAEKKAKDAQKLADERLEQLKSREQQFIQEANLRIHNKKQEVAEWDKILEGVGDEKAYIQEADKAYGIIETLQNLLTQLVSRVSPMRDKTLEQSLSDAFKQFYEALTTSIKRMRMYEVKERLPKEECKSIPIAEAKRSLDEQITSGKERLPESTNPVQQKSEEITR